MVGSGSATRPTTRGSSRLTATPARVELEMAGRIVISRVWQANVGTTRLFLLDTDLEVNDEIGPPRVGSALRW